MIIMTKKNYFKELNEIKNFTNKIRKINLDENISFESDIESDYDKSEDTQDFGDENEYDGDYDNANELYSSSTIDTIREITLKGMTKLCKTPDDPEFQTLLKIFQICNKGTEVKDDKDISKK